MSNAPNPRGDNLRRVALRSLHHAVNRAAFIVVAVALTTALTAGVAGARSSHGVAKKKLWGYEVVPGSTDPSASKLRDLKRHGVNTLIVDPLHLGAKRVARDRA